MAGQIIKRGERTWLVRVFLGRDTDTGKRRYMNKTVHGTAKDAQKFMNGTLRDIDLGQFVPPSQMTVSDFFDHWLETAARPRVSERTFAEYAYLLRKYVRPVFTGWKLTDVRTLDVQKLYADMQSSGLSARSVRYVHAVLRSAFKQAVRWQMLAQDPCSAVELPKTTRKEMLALSSEDASRFLEACASDRFAFLFKLALATGMRPEEYLGLQWKDVDLERGTVSVQRALVWRRFGKGWYFTEPKTGKSRRCIPLPGSVVPAMREHKRRQAEIRLRTGEEYQNLDLVFATENGGPLASQNIRRRHLKPIVERFGFPPEVNLYTLRHTHATMLLEAGENPKVVSERLGHSSIVLTLDVYSHVLPSMQQAAAQKLETALFSRFGTL